MDDLKIALTRSKECPLTMLLTDADSVGVFWPRLQAASHRIQTLYIDLDATLLSAVSTNLQFHRFDQLKHVFLGARDVSQDMIELHSLMTMVGEWTAHVLDWVLSERREEEEEEKVGKDVVPMGRHPT